MSAEQGSIEQAAHHHAQQQRALCPQPPSRSAMDCDAPAISHAMPVVRHRAAAAAVTVVAAAFAAAAATTASSLCALPTVGLRPVDHPLAAREGGCPCLMVRHVIPVAQHDPGDPAQLPQRLSQLRLPARHVHHDVARASIGCEAGTAAPAAAAAGGGAGGDRSSAGHPGR